MKFKFTILIFIISTYCINSQEIIKKYYPNGQLSEIGKLVNGKEQGEWKFYHENGQLYQTRLWSQGKFIDVVNCFDNKGNALKKGSLKNGNGTVHYYNELGEPTETKNYINGEEQE